MDKDEVTVEAEFTEEELGYLRDALHEATDSITFYELKKPVRKLRTKIQDLKADAEQKRRGNRPDCEEDGHTWGEQSVHEGWIVRGCEYCPKGQKRKSLEEDWETREMSEIL